MAAVIEVRTDQLRALAARAPAEKWVRSLVQIEDRDTAAPIPFELWRPQVEALRTFVGDRLIVVLKARQLGLTWLALAYAVWRMIYRPGFWTVALSRGGEEAKELARRVAFICRHLPSWLAIEGRPRGEVLGWQGTSERVVVSRTNGEPSVFQSLPASPDAGRTFTASLVLIDEWAFQEYAEEIWSSAYPTINRPGGGQVIGISTARVGTLFERIWRGAQLGENGFTPVFLPWTADPRRSAEWYEKTKRDLPNTYRAEYPSTPDEAFTIGEGAAFPEWNPALHMDLPADWYPPRGWKIVRVYDPGWVRACMKWYAISPDGDAVCYREYYPELTPDSEQAMRIVELSRTPEGAPEQIAYTVADPSAWGKQRATGESTAEIFARHGIHMRPADNDQANGWRRLHQWLAPVEGPDGPRPRLRFTQACRNTARAYAVIPFSKSEPDWPAEHEDDHLLDCDRYFVMSRPAPPVSDEVRQARAERRRQLMQPVISPVTGY